MKTDMNIVVNVCHVATEVVKMLFPLLIGTQEVGISLRSVYEGSKVYERESYWIYIVESRKGILYFNSDFQIVLGIFFPLAGKTAFIWQKDFFCENNLNVKKMMKRKLLGKSQKDSTDVKT